ncbi:type I restriction enzyme, S subunit [Tangfeifania diversioriginum]|uniref:Type I restriction enzyme, S subunit n=2 Tax=Tangfeifania diversioriginum TaxID=1168035 RepID=A0A1M6JJQ2_9BACT|nr:type I restriction enzyme, S subunit [Tangfeifania diversioriginum]
MFRQMSKENKIIPELRFPEFVKDVEWVKKKLGDIGEPLMCKRIFKEQTTSNPENGIPFYKIGTFGKQADSYIPVDLYNEYKNKYNFPNNGDILISASGTIGRLVIYDGTPAYYQDSNIVWLGHNEEQVSNGFLFYCYLMINWQTSDGGVIKRLYNSDLKNIKIIFPENKSEQQRIASCLSSLDELIAAHNDKLQALKYHKKGLMQNLFPQEGQKVPNYRFPEFENYGEWVEFELGKIAENLDSRRVPITSNKREKGDVPYYGASGIIDYVKDYIFDEELLLISEDGANLIARVYPIAFSISGKTWVNNHAHVLKFKNWYTQVLVEKYLNSKNIEDFLTGMAQPKLNRGKLDIIPIQLPKKPEEQQKIASCLSALDELITAQAEKIEQLQQHKKGLMQGLFPKMSEL